MRYLLDSNVVIAVLKAHPGVLARLRANRPEDFAIPAIVVHELHYGAGRSRRRDENLARIEALRFEILDFDREDARASGEIRASLAIAGTPIGPYDVLIAGQAVARGLILVTHNTREFGRVAGLTVEDWE